MLESFQVLEFGRVCCKGKKLLKKELSGCQAFYSNLDFWNDTWTSHGPLRKIIQGPLSREANNTKIKDVVDFSGRWDWSSIQMTFPEEVYRDIKAISVPLFVRLEDRLSWKYSAKGDFELKSAYRLVTDPLRDASFNGKWIWKLKTLLKIQMFVWKCMHHSIGVMHCLVARGLQVDAYCPRCHVKEESILHMLRDCSFSKNVWQQLGGQVNILNFCSSSSLQDWLITNATSNGYHRPGPLPWNQVFLFGIWLLWKDRNLCMFKQKKS